MNKKKDGKSIIKLNLQYNDIVGLTNESIDVDYMIKKIQQFKYNVLNNVGTGKKVRKTIYGEKISIPKEFIGKYNHVCRLLAKYQDNKINSKKIIEKKEEKSYKSYQKKHYNSIEHRSYLLLRKKLDNMSIIFEKSPILLQNYHELLDKLDKSDDSYTQKSILIRSFIGDNLIAINFLKGKEQQESDSNILFESDSIVDDSFSNDEREYNENQVIEITKIEKPKKKNRLKRALQSLIGVMGAIFIISSCAVLSYGNVNQQSKMVSIAENSYENSTEATSDNLKNRERVSNNKIEQRQENSVMKISTEVKDKNDDVKIIKKKVNRVKRIGSSIKNIVVNKMINFSTKFKVKKGSLIYTNIYNAQNKNEGLTPDYDYNQKRLSAGICVNYNNDLVSFIQIDNNLYQVEGLSKISYLTQKEADSLLNKLIKKGGRINSVLACNSSYHNIEGFYSIDDVKVLSKR